MIVSWQILRRFIDLSASPEEAAERLTMAGAEVERIERPGEKIRGVVAARVTSLEKHPTKENLFVLRLDAGTGSETTCVTAATNLTNGDRVFYGAPGASLADGTELGTRDFDGVLSAGMALSGAELGLPEVDITEGILVLPQDTLPGTDARTLFGLNDALLDVSVTPNRGDLLSVLGIARELKGLFPDSVLLPLPWEKSVGTKPWPFSFDELSLPDPGCLAYHLGLATGVRIAPSPLDVRVALTHMGMRPISNIVDATNYVMLVLGQPQHAFDLNTLPGREITVRAATDGETIVTLDGKERELTSKDMLITSGNLPIGLAGVMGGDLTGISDDTDIVVLESAAFSPLRVGHTSRRLGISSEAAFRYARGVDPVLSAMAVECALSFFADWSGAAVDYVRLSATNSSPELKPVTLTQKKLQTYLLWSNMEESAAILEGFGMKRESPVAETCSFTPPTWRPDIAIEEDLIEEIGRFRGYNDAPDILPGLLPRRGDTGTPTKLAGVLRECALARGYVEAVTYSFLPVTFVKTLRLPEDDPRAHPLPLANPISQDWKAMRTTLIPGLLKGLEKSLASGWRDPVRLFEIGRTFLRVSPDLLQHVEHDTLAGLVFNGTDPRTLWTEMADDFASVRGDVAALLATRGLEAVWTRGSEPFGHAGQTADILLDGEKIGYQARLKPAIERELGVSTPVFVFELRLSPLETVKKPVYNPVSAFPASLRDISMLAPDGRAQEDILAEIRAAAGELLESVKLFDIYSGKGIPDGYRSMAFSLSYRAPDRTLNDEEIDNIHLSVRDTLTKRGYNMR